MSENKSKPEFGFYIQIENHAGTNKLVAHVCYLNEQGEIRNPLSGYFEPGCEYADLQVEAYLDRDHEHAWGLGYSYAPHRVELNEAQNMVKVLRRIQTGLLKVQREQGYLAEGDYAGYLLRIMALLKFKVIMVANDEEQKRRSGEHWRRVEATGLQWWVEQQVRRHAKAEAQA